MSTTLCSRRILVVEDDASIRCLLEAILEAADYEGHCVATAREAIDRVTHETFAAVITDVHLPGMSGEQLLETLRCQHPRLAERLLFISGTPQCEGIERHRRSSAHAYLSKPFRIDQLLSAVEGLLDAG